MKILSRTALTLQIALAMVASGVQSPAAAQRTDELPISVHLENLSSEKAQRVLGWRPEYTLEEGLVETIEWYRQWFADHKGISTRLTEC